jgi:hypothetical protein
LDNEFDWEEGFFEQEEEELYKTIIKLWRIGDVAPKELYFLPKIDCGMLQPEEKNAYPVIFYEHQPGKVLILDEAVDLTIKDKNING